MTASTLIRRWKTLAAAAFAGAVGVGSAWAELPTDWSECLHPRPRMSPAGSDRWGYHPTAWQPWSAADLDANGGVARRGYADWSATGVPPIPHQPPFAQPQPRYATPITGAATAPVGFAPRPFAVAPPAPMRPRRIESPADPSPRSFSVAATESDPRGRSVAGRPVSTDSPVVISSQSDSEGPLLRATLPAPGPVPRASVPFATPGSLPERTFAVSESVAAAPPLTLPTESSPAARPLDAYRRMHETRGVESDPPASGEEGPSLGSTATRHEAVDELPTIDPSRPLVVLSSPIIETTAVGANDGGAVVRADGASTPTFRRDTMSFGEVYRGGSRVSGRPFKAMPAARAIQVPANDGESWPPRSAAEGSPFYIP